MIQVGTADTAPRGRHGCDIDCDCGGHWSRSRRAATTNPDGRRGRAGIDAAEKNWEEYRGGVR